MKKELTFIAAPGIILVDPLIKSKKSDMMATADSVDDPHVGFCVVVGGQKPYDANPKILQKPPVKIGDFVVYSIVGCEKARMSYKGNYRHEFVIVPFNRVLGIRLDGKEYREKMS